MDWIQFVLFILSVGGSVIGLFLWFREERKEFKVILKEMQAEQKDFHGRLCTLEERYMQLMQRMWESK